MGEIINFDSDNDIDIKNEIKNDTEDLLVIARESCDISKSMSVPIAELSTLGMGVASLIPALNTVTQTSTIATDGLYRLANKAAGDTLKWSKNKDFAWGAFKTATGKSKMAKLQQVDSLASSTVTTAINPATMMMAVALFSIEQELGNIADMEKQILSFLEIEKESEIEADVESLMSIVNKYKHNWDNEHYVASSHNMVMSIQRNARKNMNGYQKKISDLLEEKKLFVIHKDVKSTFADMEKKFQYYRLSLYTFSLASLMEIMLSGNFKEEYILGIKDEIAIMSEKYRELFGNCSVRLEDMAKQDLEAGAMKGIGTAGKAMGKLIGGIPYIKEKNMDTFLQDKGEKLKQSASDMKDEPVKNFAELGNPRTKIFMDKMEDMIRIYDHTEEICFDRERIYLIAN